ncbi:MAG: hydrogenase maturation nickel metallochaperone HypA [Kiritimatiellaeota bacterium]|nr:hydrogenase maturation nickel metallochaperone HypA [Kiritimatiellota bacterium]
MHEISICQNLVAAVLEELTRRQVPPGALRAVGVVAGQQHQLVPEALVFAYELLTKNTPAAGARLDLRLLPLEARCPACGWRGALAPPVFLCGACGQAGIELLGGHELYLESLEVIEPACDERDGPELVEVVERVESAPQQGPAPPGDLTAR